MRRAPARACRQASRAPSDRPPPAAALRPAPQVCTGDVPVRGEMRALSAADCPQEIVGLYERCTAEVPEARPTAAELLQVLAEYL